MRSRSSAAILALLLVGCASQVVTQGGGVSVHDSTGRLRQPLAIEESRAAAVLFFVTTDCPIANGYAPEIRSIVSDHAGDAFDFYLVHVDPDTTPAVAREHAGSFSLDFCPILLDVDHALVRHLGITVTPEVAVVRRDGTLAYRGRIDDLYGEIGKKRLAPRHRDLREALSAVRDGRVIDRPRTVAVGCDVPFLN